MNALMTLDLNGEEGHEFSYLFSDAGARNTILAELGRVGDSETMVRLARHICTNALPTAQAIAVIRRVRFGKASARTGKTRTRALVDRLVAVIDAEVARYDTDPQTILTALGRVVGMVEMMRDEAEAAPE
jgi:hypothetical protein